MPIYLDGINAILAEIEVVETHDHSHGRWLGVAAVPDAELHVADNVADNAAPFQLVAGADAFGAWVQILGSTDTPQDTGKVKYDLRRIEIEAASANNTTYTIEFAFGEVAATARAAGHFVQDMFRSAVGVGAVGPSELQNERHDAGTKVWARTHAIGQGAGTIDFYVELHEYDE